MNRYRHRGATLVEALIALLVMGMGMLGTLALQSRLRMAADDSRQRAEATQWALEHWDQLQSEWTLRGAAALTDSAAHQAKFGADYELTRQVTAQPGGWDIDLTVRWQGRDAAQRLRWQGSLATGSALWTAALAQGPADGMAWLDGGHRTGAWPADTRRVGPGASLWQPDGAHAWAWRLDHRRATITHRCELGGHPTDQQLESADPKVCTALPQPMVWVTGHVLTDPDTAMPDFGMQATLSSHPHPVPPSCWTRRRADATRYLCLIALRTPDTADPLAYWSGRTELTGLPWGADGWRVCRFSVDRDGNGRIDSDEHPAHYERVLASLGQQHFLLRRADRPCPEEQTVAHQP